MESAMEVKEPLDRLPLHVNAALTQIGRLFQQGVRGTEMRGIVRNKSPGLDAILRTTRQFHDALDDIEIEILAQKSVIERDLQLLRKERAARESAMKVDMAEATPQSPPGNAAAPPTERSSDVEPVDGIDPDIVMVDPIDLDLPSQPPTAQTSQPDAGGSPKTAQPQPPTTSGPAATTAPSNSAIPPAPTASLADDALIGADFVNVPPGDFDSMFGGEGGDAGGSGDDPFELDFSSLDVPPGGGEDIDALMPGLGPMLGAGTATTAAAQSVMMAPTTSSGGASALTGGNMSRDTSSTGFGGLVPPQQGPRPGPQGVQPQDEPVNAVDAAATSGAANTGEGVADAMDDLLLDAEGLGDFGADGELDELNFDSWLS